MDDYYSILGVSPTASQHEIEEAYRTLKKTDSNQCRLEELDQAYSVLSNPTSRALYHDFNTNHQKYNQPFRQEHIPHLPQPNFDEPNRFEKPGRKALNFLGSTTFRIAIIVVFGIVVFVNNYSTVVQPVINYNWTQTQATVEVVYINQRLRAGNQEYVVGMQFSYEFQHKEYDAFRYYDFKYGSDAQYFKSHSPKVGEIVEIWVDENDPNNYRWN